MPSAAKESFGGYLCGLCGALPADQTGPDSDSLQVEVMGGPEGLALYIAGYRVAGPKPLGGGTVKHSFTVQPAHLAEALHDRR